EGAREGFTMSVRLIPYLVAMLVAIGMLRASGLLDALISLIKWMLNPWLNNLAFVDALPVAFMKPFSGSGSRALMLENMEHFGVDSFQGLLSAVMQGSTETTFYVLAVYFGSVGVTRVRHAVFCGLMADIAGIIAAIVICQMFFA
ncbi:MAG: nucleoside recognition domain-containing protein, partial [Ketobacteraceae bacterium]|nr:nucleoside recognition domain-containing protein [Ketobacteraceae bacterium]